MPNLTEDLINIHPAMTQTQHKWIALPHVFTWFCSANSTLARQAGADVSDDWCRPSDCIQTCHWQRRAFHRCSRPFAHCGISHDPSMELQGHTEAAPIHREQELAAQNQKLLKLGSILGTDVSSCEL
jgi:hypothetical protein